MFETAFLTCGAVLSHTVLCCMNDRISWLIRFEREASGSITVKVFSCLVVELVILHK
jgi:hypothetical protein